MRDVTHIVAQVREELAGELRERLRAQLREQPADWLVEQLMALVLRADEVAYTIPRQRPDENHMERAATEEHPAGESGGERSLREITGNRPGRENGNGHAPEAAFEGNGHAHEAALDGDGRTAEANPGANVWTGEVAFDGNGRMGETASGARLARQAAEERAARATRVRRLALDQATLPVYLERYRAFTREVLEAERYLLDPPRKGGELISAEHRSPRGEALLTEAKDLLHSLLFCGAEDGVRLDRVQRELLTLTVPSAKSHSIVPIMRAAAETGAEGGWRDPRPVADGDRGANVLVQVEYGEVGDELAGTTIAAVLRLINNLEINELVLYGRMSNVEETTLDP